KVQSSPVKASFQRYKNAFKRFFDLLFVMDPLCRLISIDFYLRTISTIQLLMGLSFSSKCSTDTKMLFFETTDIIVISLLSVLRWFECDSKIITFFCVFLLMTWRMVRKRTHRATLKQMRDIVHPV